MSGASTGRTGTVPDVHSLHGLRPFSRTRCPSLPPPRLFSLLFFFLCFTLVQPASAGAQDAPSAQTPAGDTVTVEEQIPFDPGGSLYEIDPALRSRLELFPEASPDGTARLFRTEDGRGVVEIAYEEDGRLLRERRILGEDGLEALRADVGMRLAQLGPGAVDQGIADRSEAPDDDGRVRLILWQTGIGLGFHAWALPDILGMEEGRSFLSGYLITSGLSFLTPYLLTRNATVSTVQGRMSGWGGTRGIAYGLFAAEAIQNESDYGDDFSLGSGIGLSLAGSYLGYKTPEWADLDEGTGQVWTTMADLGTLAGLAASHASGFYDEVLIERIVDDGTGQPYTIFESEADNLRAGHLLALGTSAAGLAAGRWLGRRDRYTRGDAYALRSAAMLGSQIALPLGELASGGADRGKHYSAAAVLGGLAGIWGGSRFLRGQDWTSGEGLLLNAGQVAGSLGALGVTWIFESDTDANELAFTLAQAAGGALGLALTYRALGGPSRSAMGGRTGGGTARVELGVTPTGVTGTVRF